jgi:integrase/recombinase XerD
VRAYRSDLARLQQHCSLPLGALRLDDLYAFDDALEHLAPATRRRIVASIKSLLGFGVRLGYLPFNVGAAWRKPADDNLSFRFLEETTYRAMVDHEPNARNRTLLRFLYATGARLAEVCAVRWQDISARDGGRFQVLLHGKGSRQRVVLLPAELWPHIAALRGERSAHIAALGCDRSAAEAVFFSRKHGPLSARQVRRIVTAAAARLGVDASPHWLRHSHATHALEAGVPIHVVQATLGHARLDTTGRYLHVRPTQSSALALAI